MRSVRSEKREEEEEEEEEEEADEEEEEEEEEQKRRSNDTAPDRREKEKEKEKEAKTKTTITQQQEQQQSIRRSMGGYLGKHRLSAAISRLDQEILSLQEELDELETMEPSSAACQAVITSTEGKPDPLLPITSGPENSSWDRWFQRVRSSRSLKWWAHRSSDFS